MNKTRNFIEFSLFILEIIFIFKKYIYLESFISILLDCAPPLISIHCNLLLLCRLVYLIYTPYNFTVDLKYKRLSIHLTWSLKQDLYVIKH